MKDRLFIIFLLFSPLFYLMGKSQNYTYMHDKSKMNQILVMESGGGTLTPEVYYNLFHKNYKKSVTLPTSPKTASRITTFSHSSAQVEYADSIEEDFKKRSTVEAENLVDRTIDLAWQTIGNDITNKLMLFENNINSLQGKTDAAEISEWVGLNKQYKFAIKTIKEAYLTNSKRHEQYMAIYEEIIASNDQLIQRVHVLSLMKTAMKVANSMNAVNTVHRVKQEAIAAHNRWSSVADGVKSTKPENKK